MPAAASGDWLPPWETGCRTRRAQRAGAEGEDRWELWGSGAGFSLLVSGAQQSRWRREEEVGLAQLPIHGESTARAWQLGEQQRTGP